MPVLIALYTEILRQLIKVRTSNQSPIPEAQERELKQPPLTLNWNTDVNNRYQETPIISSNTTRDISCGFASFLSEATLHAGKNGVIRNNKLYAG